MPPLTRRVLLGSTALVALVQPLIDPMHAFAAGRTGERLYRRGRFKRRRGRRFRLSDGTVTYRARLVRVRNLPDDQVRAIAGTGGLVGIGFWPVACGGDDVAAIARSIVTAIELAGVEHVALGSDFDGAVATPFDASGMALLTDSLLGEGLSDAEIAAVMGGNAIRLLSTALPA